MTPVNGTVVYGLHILAFARLALQVCILLRFKSEHRSNIPARLDLLYHLQCKDPKEILGAKALSGSVFDASLPKFASETYVVGQEERK